MWSAEYRAWSFKRTFSTFSEASGGRTDWLCDPDVNIQSNEYATFTEWSSGLPEDWSSQRD
jgi:hypothetical protein